MPPNWKINLTIICAGSSTLGLAVWAWLLAGGGQ